MESFTPDKMQPRAKPWERSGKTVEMSPASSVVQKCELLQLPHRQPGKSNHKNLSTLSRVTISLIHTIPRRLSPRRSPNVRIRRPISSQSTHHEESATKMNTEESGRLPVRKYVVGIHLLPFGPTLFPSESRASLVSKALLATLHPLLETVVLTARYHGVELGRSREY